MKPLTQRQWDKLRYWLRQLQPGGKHRLGAVALCRKLRLNRNWNHYGFAGVTPAHVETACHNRIPLRGESPE